VKLLCDECVPYGVVSTLREAGYEVIWVREVLQAQSSDSAVLRWSVEHGCLLITCDVQDFGELVFRKGQKAVGILLLRGLQNEPKGMAQRLKEVLREHGEGLVGFFTTVTSSQVRRRPLKR
jgi:predicted nuclease of predicted toxin-antitoxin system